MAAKPNSEFKKDLYRAILTLETEEECEAFFKDLCTIPELKALSQRFAVAVMLNRIWYITRSSRRQALLPPPSAASSARWIMRTPAATASYSSAWKIKNERLPRFFALLRQSDL